MSIRKIFPAILILTFLLTLAGCSTGDGDAAGADSTAAGADTSATENKPRTEKSISVDQSAVRRGDLVQSVFADGVIRTPRAMKISAKIGGEITKVLVRNGDLVRKGQLLARIDDREYALAREEARYRHMQALSQIAAEDDELGGNPEAEQGFADGKQKLDRMLESGDLSRSEYQARILELELEALQKGAFRQDVFAQRTGLADARVAEERASLNLEYTEIRAPGAGVIDGITIVPGEIIPIGQLLCSIYDNSHLEAVVNVLEADLADLREGRSALVAVPAVDDTIAVTVDVISPRLDETSRTCEVLIRFGNPDGRFRPGMFVRAEIAARVHHDLLMVPRDAILSRDNRNLLFKVIDGDHAQWLYVDTGLENSDWIEVLKVHSGGSLAPGEMVVVSDHLTLAHEAKLKIRRTIPPRDRWADLAVTAGTDQ